MHRVLMCHAKPTISHGIGNQSRPRSSRVGIVYAQFVIHIFVTNSSAPSLQTDYQMRFYYNRELDECKYFFYGGCEGNGNNFARVEECEKECVKGGVGKGSRGEGRRKLTE